jgi:hypothetical protein
VESKSRSEGLIAKSGDRPSVGGLIEEFRRTLSDGDWASRNETAEDTRLCVWGGQSSDGKKWDKNQKRGELAFPWDGASDVKTFMVDDVCSENADQKYASFWRAAARMQGVGPEDITDSSQGSKFLDWLVHGPLRSQLDTEVELAAQYDETYGWFGLHVSWEREISRRDREVRLDDLLAMAQQAPRMAADNPELVDVLTALPNLLMDPTLEGEAIKAVQYLYDLHVRMQLQDGVVEDDILALSNKRARKAVRELRNEGATKLPVPYLSRNTPSITALKPYRDVLFPPETGDIQDAPVVFVRYFYTEAQLRTMALANDWDQVWLEEAVKTRGRYSTWAQDPFGPGQWEWKSEAGRSWLIEVVYAYYKTVDDDGICSVDYAVFNPHVTGLKDDLFAVAAPLGLDHGQYPICIGRRERLDRNISSSRGTPAILETIQNVEKSQFDSIVDLTSLAVVPPVLVPKGVLGQRLKFGPAVQNEFTPGRESKFMEVPSRGASLAFTTLEAIYTKIAERFGRFHPNVSPATSQLKLETRVGRFLLAFGAALNQTYLLTIQFDPELYKRITGADAPDSMDAGNDYSLHFDAAQLNPDLMIQKLDAYSKLLPEDAAGVIDRAKLIQVKMEMIDPSLAKALVSDTAGASAKLFRETQQDITAMAAGMPTMPRDASNDPTSAQRLKFTQQLLQAMPPDKKQDPTFQQHMEKYVKNLSMGEKQQQNKQIGRLGVSPNE